MGFIIWPAMYGNGAMTGTTRIITKIAPIRTQGDRKLGDFVYYAEVLVQ